MASRWRKMVLINMWISQTHSKKRNEKFQALHYQKIENLKMYDTANIYDKLLMVLSALFLCE